MGMVLPYVTCSQVIGHLVCTLKLVNICLRNSVHQMIPFKPNAVIKQSKFHHSVCKKGLIFSYHNLSMILLAFLTTKAYSHKEET